VPNDVQTTPSDLSSPTIVPVSETTKALAAPFQPAYDPLQKIEFYNGRCRHPSSSSLSILALVAGPTLQEITVEGVSAHLQTLSSLVKLPVLRASSGYSVEVGYFESHIHYEDVRLYQIISVAFR